MKIYLKLLLAGLLVFSLALGCKKKEKEAQRIAPDQAGERGTSCQAKNDCGSGLSCINGICNFASFDVDSTQKECYRVDCATTADCCGDKPIEAPTKCRTRDNFCNPSLVGCEAFGSCTSAADCNGGSCAGLDCSYTGLNCYDNDDCEQDECVLPSVGLGGSGVGYCSLSFDSCTSNDDCFQTNTCTGFGNCSCANPEYDPSEPICSDPDCDSVCTKVCENELCVDDTSCEVDTDCVGTGIRTLCEAGECVECLVDTDCNSTLDDEDDLDVCRAGLCVTPCKGNSECPMFSECQEGECTYVGCKSARECILANVSTDSGDPRLAFCDVEDGIGTCKIECEIDAHCALDEICDGGACEYIGCDNNDECKTILGLHNWESSTDFPWVPEGVCREPVVAAD